jgi:hypothetical protein
MTSDRRAHPRVRGPFDAGWNGASGHRAVRVVDLSVTGCFVEDIATPAVGERVRITLRLPDIGPIAAEGRVVYVFPHQGFGVAFDADERAVNALHAAMRRLS